MTTKVAVIGYPIKHSLSPKLHGYWLDKYNIDGSYEAVEVKPEDLEDFLLNMKANGYAGCNITVPHKERAFEIIGKNGKLKPNAKYIGAVNTVYFEDSIVGDNTDAIGFVENIKANSSGFDFKKGKAVILGAGGAARAVIAGLLNEDVPQVFLLNRTREKAEKIKNDFADDRLQVEDWENRNKILEDANLLVNTTSLGMEGQHPLDINLDKLPKEALVTDIVYKPLITDLLADAKARGNKIVDGLGMLLYQAVPGFEKWFGVKPEVTDKLREIILAGK